MPEIPRVSATELAVLQCLWERGPSPIRAIAQRLYPRGGTSAYATVQKLLDRLEEKDLATRDRSARAHVFAAAVPRAAFLGSRLDEMADRLCDGSFAPLLSHLVRGQSLSAEERAELRRLLDEADDADRPRRRSRRRST